MRKDALLLVLAKHRDSQLLAKFMASEAIEFLNDDDNISIADFDLYLEKLPLLSFREEEKKKLDHSVAYQKFKKADKKIPNNLGNFGVLPQEVLHTHILPRVTTKNTALLAGTSFSFHTKLKKIDYLREKFLLADCPSDVLNDVINSHHVKDYRKLYQAFMRLDPQKRRYITQAEMVLLSGEPKAILAWLSIKDSSANLQSIDEIANIIALSGSVSGFNMFFRLVPISELKRLPDLHQNVVRSGNTNLLDFFLLLTKEQHVITRKDPTEGLQLLHQSVASGNHEMVDRVFRWLNFKDSTIEQLKKNNLGGLQDLMLAAFQSPNPTMYKRVEKFFKRYQITPSLSQLRKACETGDLSAFNYILQHANDYQILTHQALLNHCFMVQKDPLILSCSIAFYR